MEDQEREMRRGWREARGVRASPEPVELGSNAPARVDLPVAFSVLAEPRHRHHCFHLPPPRQNNLLSADTPTRPPNPHPTPESTSLFLSLWAWPCCTLHIHGTSQQVVFWVCFPSWVSCPSMVQCVAVCRSSSGGIRVLWPCVWGHLGGARPLALGSSSAMNAPVQMSASQSSSLLRAYLGVEWLGPVATLHLTF